MTIFHHHAASVLSLDTSPYCFPMDSFSYLSTIIILTFRQKNCIISLKVKCVLPPLIAGQVINRRRWPPFVGSMGQEESQEGIYMSKKFFIICISIVGALAVAAAAVAAFVIIKEKHKKDEAELEHYLDSAIQWSGVRVLFASLWYFERVESMAFVSLFMPKSWYINTNTRKCCGKVNSPYRQDKSPHTISFFSPCSPSLPLHTKQKATAELAGTSFLFVEYVRKRL